MMDPWAWQAASATLPETVRQNVRKWAQKRGHRLRRFRGFESPSIGPNMKAATCVNAGCSAKVHVDKNAYRGDALVFDCPHRPEAT